MAARRKSTSPASSVSTQRPFQRSIPPPPPFSSRFFDSSSQIRTARATYFKIFLGGGFLITLTIFAIFSIYWGALWRLPAHNLQGWVVDFDGSRIGANVLAALTATSPQSGVTWTQRSASDFPNGPAELGVSVTEEHCWAAIAINPNSTARFQVSLASPNASYNGAEAITVYAAEARNENAFRTVIRPSVQATLTVVTQKFALAVAKQISSAPTSQLARVNVTALLATSPQTLLTPVDYTIQNQVPFDVPVASAVTFVGLIYMLILSFLVVMIANAARDAAQLNTLLTLPSLIALRLGSAFAAAFVLSLFYSLLNMAFQLPFTRKFGHAGFVLFWMLNWVGMLAVGLALESLITILTIRFIPFFMVFWIITNVSVSILPIEVLPRIYNYGYAAPFYNVSHAVRTIVFGTKNNLGQDFGILLVWVAVSCLTLPLIQWLVRRRAVRAAQADADAAAERGEQGRGAEMDEADVGTGTVVAAEPADADKDKEGHGLVRKMGSVGNCLRGENGVKREG